jgi:hypothetical protein
MKGRPVAKCTRARLAAAIADKVNCLVVLLEVLRSPARVECSWLPFPLQAVFMRPLDVDMRVARRRAPHGHATPLSFRQQLEHVLLKARATFFFRWCDRRHSFLKQKQKSVLAGTLA